MPLLHTDEKYRQLHLDELRKAIIEDESKYGETSYGRKNYTYGKSYFQRKKYRLPQGSRTKMNGTNRTRIFEMLARQNSPAN